jgi:hypothetical protein
MFSKRFSWWIADDESKYCLRGRWDASMQKDTGETLTPQRDALPIENLVVI